MHKYRLGYYDLNPHRRPKPKSSRWQRMWRWLLLFVMALSYLFIVYTVGRALINVCG